MDASFSVVLVTHSPTLTMSTMMFQQVSGMLKEM